MICSARRWVLSSLLLLAAALGAACTKTDRIGYADIRTSATAALLPKELALMYLQNIKSQKTSRTGEPVIPPCQLTETGTWSGGAYERRTLAIGPTVLSPMDIPGYNRWILFKIENRNGDDLTQATLERVDVRNYSLRSPKTAKSLLGTIDHCVIGPTTEPPRKIIEALVSLGVDVAPDFAYIVPKR